MRASIRRTSIRRRSLTRLLTASFVVVLAMTAGTSAARFLWCPEMQQAHLTRCCNQADSERTTVQAPCCEEQRSFAPDSTQAHEGTPRILAASAAPQVALFGPVVDDGAVRGTPLPIEARAGPSIRLYAEHSIYLL